MIKPSPTTMSLIIITKIVAVVSTINNLNN